MPKCLNFLVLLTGLLSCILANGQTLEVPQSDKDIKKLARSNWAFSLSFSNSRFESTHSFQGTPIFDIPTPADQTTPLFFQELTPETINPIGAEFNLRREFAIGPRLSFSIGAGAHYFISRKSEEFPIEEDSEINAGEIERNFDQFGFNLQANLYFLHFIVWKKYKVQPFIGLSLFRSNSENEYRYAFNNLGPAEEAPGDRTNVNELYDVTQTDRIAQTRLGIGAELIAPSGLFSFIQLSFTSTTIEESDQSGFIRTNGEMEATNCDDIPEQCSRSSNDIPTFISATIGFGYRF